MVILKPLLIQGRIYATTISSIVDSENICNDSEDVVENICNNSEPIAGNLLKPSTVHFGSFICEVKDMDKKTVAAPMPCKTSKKIGEVDKGVESMLKGDMKIGESLNSVIFNHTREADLTSLLSRK